MDGRRTQALELIGGHDEASVGWQMHAFDTADQPGLMRLTVAEPGLLLLDGDEVRRWLRIQTADAGRMTARWERRVDGQWLRWMDMRFERERERDGTVR